MEFSEKIKELRLQKHMTLEQVGKIVGVGKSTVRKWENGYIKDMGRTKIALLATALGVSPSYLMNWPEDKNDQEIHSHEDESMSTSNPGAWKRLSGGVAKFTAAELDQLLGAAIAIKPSAFKETEEKENEDET